MRRELYCIFLLALFLAGCGTATAVYVPAPPAHEDTIQDARALAGQSAESGGAKTAAEFKGWGDLTGRFVVKGQVPTLSPPRIDKDVAFCKPKMVPNESIVVGEDNGLANVVILVRKDVPVKPELTASEPADAILDNKGCRFEPHILLMRVGQNLLLKNSDTVGHNTNGALSRNDTFNPVLGALRDFTVDKAQLQSAEDLPRPVSCNIHPWMKAHLLIRDNPYFAKTGQDGRFTIKDLPAGGEVEFVVWHESVGRLEVNDWERGQFKMTLKAGPEKNDLGVIEVPAELFKQ